MLRAPQGKRSKLVLLLLQWARDSGVFEGACGESVYLRTAELTGRFRAWVDDDANGIEWAGETIGKGSLGARTPQQPDCVSCGVYMLLVIWCFMCGVDPASCIHSAGHSGSSANDARLLTVDVMR